MVGKTRGVRASPAAIGTQGLVGMQRALIGVAVHLDNLGSRKMVAEALTLNGAEMCGSIHPYRGGPIEALRAPGAPMSAAVPSTLTGVAPLKQPAPRDVILRKWVPSTLTGVAPLKLHRHLDPTHAEGPSHPPLLGWPH